MGVETLRAMYPWPPEMPDVPEDWHGWMCPETAKALVSRLDSSTNVVVECGTWLGVSAKAILTNAPNTHLVCIDTWAGSPEHHVTPGWSKRLPTLHEVCRRNLWPWRERVTLIRKDSLIGLGQVFDAGIKPDLIYLDSKHTFGRVSAELYLCLELFPDSPIVGDDYSYAAVALAADRHSRDTGRPLVRHGDAAFAMPAWRSV